MTATKVSICYFLLRVVVRRSHLWITYGVMGINILSGIAFFFITLFQCKPVDAFWNRDPLNPGKCLGMDAVITITYIYSACGIICDFTCTFLPMFIISGLNMDRRTKFALMPIMALACVASAATVVRFVYCKDAKNPDFLYATINIVIWSTIEQGLAVTAGSLATLRPLLRSLAHKLGWSTARPSEPRASEYVKYPGESGNNPMTRGLQGDEIRLTPMKNHHAGREASVTANDSMKENSRWQTRITPATESEEELQGLSTNSADYGQGKILRIETFHMREDRV
ncbi:Fc.00g043700.m01.CDS01 [Cosmosporella sp. VM-42]